MGTAISDYNMIVEGDRVMMCLSDGKDSCVMLDILLRFRKKEPVNFDLVAFHLDQKQPGYPARLMTDYLKTRDI